MRLTPLNTLPPRKEYLEKVLRCLAAAERTEKEIISATGLTKTQALCALEALMKQHMVTRDKKSKYFALASLDNPTQTNREE